MSNLIDSLRRQHEEIKDLIQQLDGHISSSRLIEAEAVLDRLRESLQQHLALEDGELYPGLARLAEEKQKPHLASTARLFSENMARISGSVLGFVERHRARRSAPEHFAREWAAVRDALQARFGSEESTLYPMYERLSRR